MSYRLAKSLVVLRAQIDDQWSTRSKVSDGWIGDADHASRASDHNPWVPPPRGGVVTALDVTHDPDGGPDMHEVTEALRESRDPRIKYVIWDADDAKGMFSSYATSTHPPFTWRPYSGPNLHTVHAHISVQPTPNLYDSTRAWNIQGKDWFAMATKAELREVVKEQIDKAVTVLKKEMAEQRTKLAVGTSQKTYNPDNVNLKKAIR